MAKIPTTLIAPPPGKEVPLADLIALTQGSSTRNTPSSGPIGADAPNVVDWLEPYGTRQSRWEISGLSEENALERNNEIIRALFGDVKETYDIGDPWDVGAPVARYRLDRSNQADKLYNAVNPIGTTATEGAVQLAPGVWLNPLSTTGDWKAGKGFTQTDLAPILDAWGIDPTWDQYLNYATKEGRAESALKNKTLRDEQLWGKLDPLTGKKTGGLYGTTLGNFLSEIERQYAPVYANTATSFATRGMTGSMGDIATTGKLREELDRKKLDYTGRASNIVSGVSAADDTAMQNILRDLSSGASFDTALDTASSAIQNSLRDAQSAATNTNLAGLFSDFGDLYDRSLDQREYARGYGGSSGRRSSGGSTYQGSIF